jgi:chaperonin cofactor prefoldin
MPTLEERVATLEARVDAYTMSSTDTRVVLAGLQDQMNRRFEQTDRRFEQMDRRFEQMDRRFEQMDRRFEQVDQRFAALQDQMNRRFEQVDQRFTVLQDHMNQRFDAVDQKIDRHFTWLVGIQVAVLVAVVGALVAPYYR